MTNNSEFINSRNSVFERNPKFFFICNNYFSIDFGCCSDQYFLIVYVNIA